MSITELLIKAPVVIPQFRLVVSRGFAIRHRKLCPGHQCVAPNKWSRPKCLQLRGFERQCIGATGKEPGSFAGAGLSDGQGPDRPFESKAGVLMELQVDRDPRAA